MVCHVEERYNLPRCNCVLHDVGALMGENLFHLNTFFVILTLAISTDQQSLYQQYGCED